MKKIVFIVLILSSFLFAEEILKDVMSKKTYINNHLKSEYYLDDYHEDINNTHPVCKAYVDALNNYPLVEDFFQTPMQPNSPEFDYPRWEKLDIYENKQLFINLRTYRNNVSKYKNTDRYLYFATKEDFFKEFFEANKTKSNDMYARAYQMYHTKIDINNDGYIDDIVRLDDSRYAYRKNLYQSTLFSFAGNGKFDAIDKKLSNSIPYQVASAMATNLFIYKNETYIKDVGYDIYDVVSYGIYIYIYKFNKDDKLDKLCSIDSRDKNTIKDKK